MFLWHVNNTLGMRVWALCYLTFPMRYCVVGWIVSCFGSLRIFLRIRSAILPTSTSRSIIVTTIVRAMDTAIVTSGLSHSEKHSLVQAPRRAPGIVMVSLPKKNAVKNFAGLYFRSPRV